VLDVQHAIQSVSVNFTSRLISTQAPTHAAPGPGPGIGEGAALQSYSAYCYPVRGSAPKAALRMHYRLRASMALTNEARASRHTLSINPFSMQEQEPSVALRLGLLLPPYSVAGGCTPSSTVRATYGLTIKYMACLYAAACPPY
jgi:hypothetical protein